MKITSSGFTFSTQGTDTWTVFSELQEQLNEYMTLGGTPEKIEYLDFDLTSSEIHIGLKG